MDNVRTENIDLNVASHAYYFNIADFIVKILFEDISKTLVSNKNGRVKNLIK